MGSTSVGADLADIRASERLMVGMRWLIVAWAVFQVSVDGSYYPDGVRAWAYGLAGLLLVGNLGLYIAIRRTTERSEPRRIAISSLGFDLAIAMAFVWLYAYDPDRSLWALMFLIPVEGAARFRMRGVLLSWAGVAGLYVLKELWAASTYGFVFDIDSITFRMGLVLLVGVLAGRLAEQLHEQKAGLAEALEEVERIDAWRARLVQMLAHDLRSPLGTIDSTAQLMTAKYDQLEPQVARRLLQTIQRQSARVQHLAMDLLDLARIESDTLRLMPEPFDLRELVEQTAPLVSGADGVSLEGVAAPVVADRQRMEQVLVNLITNALRHGRAPVRVITTCADGVAGLSVVDSGDGVAADRIHDLFDAFSGDGTGSSVGLGLWMARTLVEAHGGSLEYHRQDNQTVFRAELSAGPAPLTVREAPLALDSAP